MRKLTISTREEAGVSEEAVYALFCQSFQQWTNNGIDAPFLHTTLEEFKEAIHNAFVYVATDAETGELIGTHTLQPKRNKNYVRGCFLAISPHTKHTGIATQMLRYEEECLQEKGFDYILGTTAVNAIWSVKWHLKNGYRIVGYGRSNYNNQVYATYLFRKQISPSFLWSGPLAPITAGFRFLISYSINNICKTSTGKDNLIGRIARYVFRKNKRNK